MMRCLLAHCDAEGHGGLDKRGRDSMRGLIAIVASAAMVVAQVPLVPAYAETLPPAPQVVGENSTIAQTFKAFPNGGEALSKQIAKLLVANPKLAPDLVIYMRNTQGLNRAQKLAAEQGLASAADALKIKAAEIGVPQPQPRVTKEGIYAPEPDDLWLLALGLLAVGAAICAAACGSTPGGGTPPTTNTFGNT
jgi:hypothetical protein